MAAAAGFWAAKPEELVRRGFDWSAWATAKSWSECADIVGKFSLFFVNKVRRIRDNIASALQQSSFRMFPARPHIGPELSDFQPVTIDEVRKLLASIPHETSPLDVLPVSLLKDCAELFASVITYGTKWPILWWCVVPGHHHTRQLVTPDRKVPSTLQSSACAADTEEGQLPVNLLQADI